MWWVNIKWGGQDTEKSKSKIKRGSTRENAVFTRSQIPKFSKKTDKKSEPQRILLHALAHAQWNRTAPLWRQTSYSVSIKCTQSHTSQSHLIYRRGRQASWVRHRVSQPHSNTRLLTLIHRKLCEWAGKMIGKYSQAIRPQLENSHLPCWLSSMLWNEYYSKNQSMLCVWTWKAIN